MSKTVILGGGLAGFSLAHFLDEETLILEKEKQLGGLCRSFDLNGIKYDVGPHIIFSKNEDTLAHLLSLTETNRIKRSNQIFHKGKFIKYPFENHLSLLDEQEKEYCLQEFLHNPYEDYDAKNMLQFFLKTFGEGITRLYLQGYNEKIWKYDPSFMDTQMVERIPKPPKEDIIKSAKGEASEGYLHQLYFNYPKSGGTQSLVDAYQTMVKGKAEVINPVEIKSVAKVDEGWAIKTDRGEFNAAKLINCMPLHEFVPLLQGVPAEVKKALGKLQYNSIYTVVIQTKEDKIGDNFAMTIADKDVIFHRLSKINFFGENYDLKDGKATILAEVTYRPESYLATIKPEELVERVVADLDRIGLVKRSDVIATEIKSFKYAYVIYDLDHRQNADTVLNYLSGLGIDCVGRFAEFEYLNMDAIVERTKKLAASINGESSK